MKLQGKEYTARDLGQIFDLIRDDVGKEMWQKASSKLQQLPAPSVKIHCIRSHSRRTMKTLVYPYTWWFPFSGYSEYGFGDGTVNQISADVCLQWRSQPDPDSFHDLLVDADHVKLLTNGKTIDYILTRVLRI